MFNQLGQYFYGAILITFGLLFAGLCGTCDSLFLWSLIKSGFQEGKLANGVNPLLGLVLFFVVLSSPIIAGGFVMIRAGYRRFRPKPSSWSE